MGFLMLAGLIGTIAYGTHCVKNDIKAEVADFKCTPSLNVNSNKNDIRRNFTVICKRAGIKLSNDGLPMDEVQCHKGMEYLQYRGYDPESVEFFNRIFHKKCLRKLSKDKSRINGKHSKLKGFLKTTNQQDVLVTFRKDYYGSMDAPSRMKMIMENPLWNRIVDNYTYIRSGNSAKYTEVWNFRVPANFFKSKGNLSNGQTTPSELYEEVCWIQGLDNGSFM